ncbi:MAG: DUF4386 domain-containing protein [Saprospiraceae bacterium]|nr:DUF4386 domain-containing protein [Lewinella sp.]
MSTSQVTITRSQSAVIAAIALLIMAIIAPIAVFGMIGEMLDVADATKTFQNISNGQSAFRTGIVILLVVAVLDIVTSWALYLFFHQVNDRLSLLAAWFRLVYTAILAAAAFFLIQALQWINAAPINALGTDLIAFQTSAALQNFQNSWNIGLAIFGFHLLLLGYLAYRAAYLKKILGVLLLVAGLGYIIDGFGKLLSSGYTMEVSTFTFIGEVVLIFWLFIKGRRL